MKQFLLFIILLLAQSGVVLHADDLKPQTTCPLDNEPTNRAFYADVEGYRIYTCSTACVEKVTSDAANAIEALKQRGEKPAQIQTLCPIMENKKIKKKLYVDLDGKRLYLCCKSCVRKAKKDPATYITKMEAQGIVLDDSE